MRKLIIGCIGSVLTVLLVSGCRTPDTSYQKQEYKFVRLTWGDKGSPDEKLNELGGQGWKIEKSQISYTPYLYTGDFLFARPAQSSRPTSQMQ